MNKLLIMLVSSLALFTLGNVNAVMDAGANTEALLSDTEMSHLVFMREEEKLARDSYITLYDLWGSKLFTNISRAEQMHMDALLTMLDAYGVDDPITSNEVGVFNDATLADLYQVLIARGETSLLEALHVGALIEEVDIRDIQQAIDETSQADIVLIYENLMAGSFSHLRAFVGQIEAMGVEYKAQVLDQSEVDAILGNTDGGIDPGFVLNAGLNDAWFNPETTGQGFFITVLPHVELVYLAWFTYDTEQFAEDAEAVLGGPGQRWLTALGPFSNNMAQLEISISTGGIFDTGDLLPVHEPGGTIILQFDNCASGTVSYEIPSINRMGVVPIERIAPDNVALCEELAETAN
jgi:hypothetical protein